MELANLAELMSLGSIGHLLVILAFVSVALACVSYFMATREGEVGSGSGSSWKRIGRIAFTTHLISIIGIFLILYTIIAENRYEYYYAWRHTSAELPFYYKISSFWEGQEGSFLLWMFWHVVLGSILMFKARSWEAPVMTTFSLVQTFLVSMIMGVYFLGYRLGSSPFVLLRDVMQEAPIFQLDPNFVPEIGNGLNPLLQNYWMVIHPPILFLGFAATLIPFAYAIAGLWLKKYGDWIKIVHPWAIFGVMILGTGVLMGGAWAYESLSFGGFWAWDPVENASLFPWLTLIAGLHALMVFKSSGRALRLTYILFFSSFVLVLYATFLTRSGILGDTSVHAFTALGMLQQLVIYVLVFFFGSILLLAIRWKELPVIKKEESVYSREFWMFIGALVFFISMFQIVFDTSRPVINALIGTNLAPPSNVILHYNQWQLPIATIIAILSAIGLYLKFKKTNKSYFFKKISIPFFISIVIAALIAFFGKIEVWHYILFLFAGCFAVTANFMHIISVFPRKQRISGAPVAHIGFGVLIVGILISNHKQEVISLNTMGIDFGDEFTEDDKRENILLYKDMPMQMGEYLVTYKGDSFVAPNTLYHVNYKRIDPKTGNIKEEFDLYPNAQINPDMGGLIANPDTKHYLTRDIFTHITSVPVDLDEEKLSDTAFVQHWLYQGDTIFTSNASVIFKRINPRPDIDIEITNRDIAASAVLLVQTREKSWTIEPVYMYVNDRFNLIEAEIKELGLTFKFFEIDPEQGIPGGGKIRIGINESTPVREYIIMQATMFPYINLVWMGGLILIVGYVISMRRRYQQLVKSRK